jgi:polyhydroxyalkanoate synthesis regulator phasin
VKLQKTLVLPLTALLLIGAAGAVLATSRGPSSVDDGAVVPAVESPSPSAAPGMGKSIEDTALADVLDDLVSKGTITAAQKTAILDALVAEKEARRTERQAERQQLKDFLADGAITQDELDKLPEDSPLRQLSNLMDDGKITTDELRGLGRGFGKGGGHWFGRGFGHGGGMWGEPPVEAPASPTTSS